MPLYSGVLGRVKHVLLPLAFRIGPGDCLFPVSERGLGIWMALRQNLSRCLHASGWPAWFPSVVGDVPAPIDGIPSSSATGRERQPEPAARSRPLEVCLMRQWSGVIPESRVARAVGRSSLSPRCDAGGPGLGRPVRGVRPSPWLVRPRLGYAETVRGGAPWSLAVGARLWDRPIPPANWRERFLTVMPMAGISCIGGGISHTGGRFQGVQDAIRQTEGTLASPHLSCPLDFGWMLRLVWRLRRVRVPSVCRIAPCIAENLPSLCQIAARWSLQMMVLSGFGGRSVLL